jgi:hypothetical protein
MLVRIIWSPRAASHARLCPPIKAFGPPDAPIVLGLDARIERWRGATIKAKVCIVTPHKAIHYP